MEYTRKKLLGVVGVDSGHLVVIDPCRIRGLDVIGSDSDFVFWGANCSKVKQLLQKEGFKVETGPYKSGIVRCVSDSDVKKIINTIMDSGLSIMYEVRTGSFFDRAFEATDNDNQGGQVCDRFGYSGCAVSFVSGLGDGEYEVWAYYADCDEWGERIAKVEIVLIQD